jgi:hypothetical protein
MIVTIARWQCGNYQPHGDRVTAYAVTSPIPAGLLETCSGMEQVRDWLHYEGAASGRARCLKREDLTEAIPTTYGQFHEPCRPDMGDVGHGWVGVDGDYQPAEGETVVELHEWEGDGRTRATVRVLED